MNVSIATRLTVLHAMTLKSREFVQVRMRRLLLMSRQHQHENDRQQNAVQHLGVENDGQQRCSRYYYRPGSEDDESLGTGHKTWAPR